MGSMEAYKKSLGCGDPSNKTEPATPCSPSAQGQISKNYPYPTRNVKAEREAYTRSLLEGAVELGKITESKRRMELASLHPLLFGRIYFPHWLPCEFSQMHWDMATAYRDLWRYAVCAPVGIGKTVALTKIGLLWSVFFEPVKELLLISLSQDMASTWLNEMALACSDSSFLRYDFGDFKGSHWGSTDLEFIFKHPNGRTRRRCVILGRGIGCAVRGMRPDRIILDDPQDENNIKTERVRGDFVEWLKGAVLTRLDTPNKKLTYVATAFDERAYICDLITAPLPGWKTQSFSILDEHGNSTWPEKYPNEVLTTRRMEMGEARFQADFCNAPLSARGGRVFNESHIQTIDDHKVGKAPDSWVTMAIDPSFTPGGDNWAVTVVEQTRSGMWYVLECMADNTGLGPCLEAVFSLLKTYKGLIREIAAEVGGGGQGSLRFNMEDMSKRRGISLPSVRWLSHTAKRSKDQRIQQLLPLMESGRICLKSRHSDLREEILSYRPDDSHARDDMVDSLAMHMEIQIPRRDHIPEKESYEAGLHRRAEGMKKIRNMGKKKPDPTEKWLGV